MNKHEYNQNMVDFLSRVHSNCMQTLLDHNSGCNTHYPQHNELRELVGRECMFAALDFQAELAHALRFNHVLDRAARCELLKRKIQDGFEFLYQAKIN